MKNKHYNTIGVAPEATPEEIKMAYREKAKKLHPDKNGGDDRGFAELARAYEVLSDPERRERYDKTGFDSDKKEKDQVAFTISVLTIEFLSNINDVKTNSLTEFIKTVMEKKKHSLGETLARIEGEQSKASEIKSRLSKTSGENTILTVIEQRIAENEQNKARVDLEISVCDKIIEEISDYKYETEEPKYNGRAGRGSYYPWQEVFENLK